MRKNQQLAALFPGIRLGILYATVTKPEKWWYLSELAVYLDTSPSSLQRELSALVKSGILQERRDGARRYIKVQDQSPLYPELRRLFEKAYGVAATLTGLLQPWDDKIQSAFLFGSMARGEEHTFSDIDLMVVGEIGLADLAPALRKGEAALGREINVINYSPAEFLQKIKEKNHFLMAVLQGAKTFVKGDESDLVKLAGKQASAKAYDVKKRIKRNA
ncbi:MAG TPA: nucleotidyltransferase domain-containing protein [Candidatus Angelobacter sp.]|nr:nucleotidyltransferase domain-containing protein [Candidatus Angelobacter sp.]